MFLMHNNGSKTLCILLNNFATWGCFSKLYIHQDKMSVCFIPPTSHFYIVKLGLQGYTFFLNFALKHRLWVLVRTASMIYVLSKNKKNTTFFSFENNHIYSREILK